MEIDEFLGSSACGDVSLLKRLYDLIGPAERRDVGYAGLLSDNIGRHIGTVLYDPCLTPRNSLTFARTGTDDVHFGLLSVNDRYGDVSPVVMTVPMLGETDYTNLIMGETLHEFLCLGCVHGFSEMDSFAYFPDVFFEKYSQPSGEDEYAAEQEFFRRYLSLSPWPVIESRLSELQDKYASTLEFDGP